MSTANRVDKFARQEWFVAAAFFAVAFAIRLPFRSQFAYHWDSAQFTLAIREYSVALSQPHAPGYFLYVMLGRLVNLFVGDPHASLVWISLVFGSALCSMLYFLGSAMFGRRTGFAAALLGMTSPQIWFHSCVGLTYAVDGFLVCVTVLICWRAIQRGGTWADAVVIGVLLAMVGGVRQQSAIALSLLALYTFWQFRERGVLKLIVAALVSILLALAWFVPMVKMSGGLPVYLHIVRLHSEFCTHKSLAGAGWAAVPRNFSGAAQIIENGLMLGLVVLVGALFYNVFRLRKEGQWSWGREHARALGMLVAWIVPLVLLLIFGFVDEPGHLFSYLPAWLLFVAAAIAHLRKTWAFAATTAAICLVNVLAFVAWPQSQEGTLAPMGRYARQIRHHDDQLTQIIRTVRLHYQPADTVLCYAREHFYYGFRHFQLYLPEFDQYQLVRDPTLANPDDKPLWHSRAGRLEFVGGLELDGKRTLLLVVPPRYPVSLFQQYMDVSNARPVAGSSGILYELPVDSLSQDRKM